MRTLTRRSGTSPKNLIRDVPWDDDYLESHHELESVGEDAMYEGFEDTVYEVGEYFANPGHIGVDARHQLYDMRLARGYFPLLSWTTT